MLSVTGLTHRFGGLTALDDLTFVVEEGTIYSIIGPNGAGKSTLFNCICGIYRPDQGAVRFRDEEITGRKPHQVARRGIARTFQNLELFRHMSTMENLMLGRHLHMRSGIWSGATMLHRRSRAAREEVEHRERVEEIIDLLDLHAARDRYIWQLPYGTQKLVELG
ncbi:MAG TPA: ATP-binding cassette domain-containing protein, partial [Thermoanaerobaculia bacterium]|nr:ATP-binding cassette domain-containing protein [Thermoanaerobaculia bacterium]